MVSTGRGLAVFDQLSTEVETLRSAIERERDVSRNALSRRVDVLFIASLIGALVALSVALSMWVLVRRRVVAPLEILAAQAETVAAGRLDTPISASGSIEIATVARSAEQMRVQLLGEIKAAFSTGMVAAESAERARLAGELHDDPIQVLTSAQWQLEALIVALDAPQREAAQQVVRSLADVQDRLRTLMFRLHPPGLDDEGLAIALDDLLTDTFDGTDVTIDLRVAEFGSETPGVASAPGSATAVGLRVGCRCTRRHDGHAAVPDRCGGDPQRPQARRRVTDRGRGARHRRRGAPVGHPTTARAPRRTSSPTARTASRSAGRWRPRPAGGGSARPARPTAPW